jgi:hypothetical protein
MGVALGRALSDALSRLRLAKDPDPLSAIWPMFSRQVAYETGIGAAIYFVSLEDLAEKARTGHLFDASEFQHSTHWGREIAKRLEQAAIPIFQRQERLSRQSAAAIRLTSLCLAVEIETHTGIPGVGGKFRKIAAGATLLEERLCGEHPPTETIILALK